MSKIKIIVATHKKYQMPTDSIYLPLHVGKKDKDSIGYQGDDSGINISDKNPYFCELTALFWAWKNLDVDYVGLSHYRRHFSYRKKGKSKFNNIITEQEVNHLLSTTDVILPKERKYYIESVYSHYAHTHYEKDLIETKNIIAEKYPEYLEVFDSRMKMTHAHMFNMFIMKKSVLDQYCTFLFDILFELESRVDIYQYSAFQARLFGRVSELLLDVWITKNKINYKEVKAIHMEEINWVKKGKSFIIAKFRGKKYEGSF